jgi:hypothetical protein
MNHIIQAFRSAAQLDAATIALAFRVDELRARGLYDADPPPPPVVVLPPEPVDPPIETPPLGTIVHYHAASYGGRTVPYPAMITPGGKVVVFGLGDQAVTLVDASGSARPRAGFWTLMQ